MGFAKKLLIFSSFVLLASIFTLKSIDFNQCTDKMMKMMVERVDSVLKIDSFLKGYGIRGFHRLVENTLSHMQFYLANKSAVKVESREFDGVEVLIFEPIEHEPNRPAIIHFHGSGWIYYNPRSFTTYLSEMASRLNILIVSVNYRKAPEHPYPAGYLDCLVATKYFLKNAEKFNVNPNRIALLGESAGGNLAVAVTYQLAKLAKIDKGMRLPKIIIPSIPTLQMADFHTPSFRDDSRDEVVKKHLFVRMVCLYAFGELSQEDLDDCINVVSTNSHLSEEAVEKVRDNIDWKKYLSGSDYDKFAKSTFKPTSNKFIDKLSKLVMDPLFSPLSALNNTELALLPPVFLVGASKDPLRDDSKLLAARLAKIKHVSGYKQLDQYHAQYMLAGIESQELKDFFTHLASILKRNAIL